MTTTSQDDLHKLIEKLGDTTLDEARGFLAILSQEPDDPTEEEIELMRQGEEDFRRHSWVSWDDVKLSDV